MDLVGSTLVFTFVAMLLTGLLVTRLQRPPAHRTTVRCPQDQAPATVALSWEPERRRMLVVDCDHRHAREGRCDRSCEGALQQAFPEVPPATVTP